MAFPLALMARRCLFGLLAIGVVGALAADPGHARDPRVPAARGKPLANTTRAAPPPASPTLSSARNPAVTARDAILVIDAASGRELEASNADELRHPASLTKMMTLYLVFEALDQGRLRLGDTLNVSARAVSVQPTRMGAVAGGRLTVRDAVMGMIVRSANDAATVVAENLGEDEVGFARLMTQKARDLGMSRTTFRNASGLPHPEQVTTARDMATLGRALLRDFPHYYPLFSVTSYPYGTMVMTGHNRVLQSYHGADGIKTGYINSSGFNLVTSAVRGGRRLVGVVLGGDSAGERDAIMAEMLDVGFDDAAKLGTPPWKPSLPPASARYAAANFAPGARLPDAPQVATAAAPPRAAAALVPPTQANAAAATERNSVIGRWALQIGAYTDRNGAMAAVQRALAAAPDLRRSTTPLVEKLLLAGRTIYRARLLTGDEDSATRGCQRLEARKIDCAAVEIGSWSGATASQ